MKPRQRLRRGIVAGAVALVAAITGAGAYDSWRLHQQLMAANQRELGNLAHALAKGTAGTMQAVDLLLRETAAWYESTGRHATPAEIVAALASRAAGVAEVSVLTVVDAQGGQRFRSRDTGEPLADVADRSYFQRQRDAADAGMVISEPMVTRTERLPGLVVSRRLERPGGSFDGVVTAIVTMQQIQTMYSAIELGARSTMLLTLDDGTLVVRQPGDARLATDQKFPELLALRGGALVDRAVDSIDGRRKLVAALGVGNLRLIVALTRDEQEALSPWHDELVSASIRTAAISILVALIAAALLRQLRRLERGELALRESEERYAMAMDAANEGHAEWKITDDTVFASDKWRALHGIDARAPLVDAAGLARLVQIHPDDAAPVQAAIDDHLAGRTNAIELEYRVRHGGEAWCWIHARGRCVRDAAGAPLRLFCAATDISARKEAQAAQAALEARLRQAERLEALGTLAGGIAHDFNNILGAILGFGDMARRQAEAGTPLRRHVDRVLQAGARARLLVRRILDFSRSGVVQRLPVNLQGVVEEALAMLAPSLSSELQVSMQLEAGTAAVAGDATQLHQVVMNLCTNAVQAMGDTGVLQVRLTRRTVDAPRALLHGGLAAGEYVQLEVVDSGIGIPADLMGRIFDPFFTTKHGGEGTGLGLSVVHGIVSDIGGAIDVVSAPGAGTAVSVWLPLSGELEPSPPCSTDDLQRGRGEVVMIVDDERPLLELGEELLAGLGYEPAGFDSGETALRVFKSDPDRFDVVLTDEMLPGLPGSELARAVHAVRPELPVVLISGKVGVALEQRARDAGVAALLHKPVAPHELAECLAQVLGKHPSSRSAPRERSA